MVCTGLSEPMASWKIIAISRPRIRVIPSFVELKQILVVEFYAALQHGVGAEELHDRKAGQALAAATLSDQSENLAIANLQIDAMDDVQERRRNSERNRQVVDP